MPRLTCVLTEFALLKKIRNMIPGRKVPKAHKSKTIHGIEMKFGRVVENHKLINLV